MRVVVYGRGRIARAIAAALADPIVVLHVGREGPAADEGEGITAAVLAAPGGSWVEERVGGLPARAPFLSVAGNLNMQELRGLAPNRPIARFMCSCATRGGEDLGSLRLLDGASDTEAAAVLRRILPSPRWREIPSERFDRASTIYTVSALGCGLVGALEEQIGLLDLEDRLLAADCLEEAARLLRAHRLDPAAAFESALTPDGSTRRMFGETFQIGIDSVRPASAVQKEREKDR